MTHTDLAANELLSALALAIPDLVFVVDVNGRYRAAMGGSDHTRYRNPQRATVLVGKRMHDMIPAELADQCQDAIRRALATGTVQVFTYVLEDGDISHSNSPSERRRRWFEARVAPVPDTSGAVPSAVVVASNITEQVVQQARLEQMAWQDELTGAANRKAFIHRVTEMVELCRRHGQDMVIAMLDVEQLARVNRHCGTTTGDMLLSALADTLTANVRISDVLTRIDADGFALLMPCTDLTGAGNALHRVRDVILATTFHCNGHEIGVSFSAGFSAYPHDAAARAISIMLQGAEQALVAAKAQGRGRIVPDNRDQAPRSSTTKS